VPMFLCLNWDAVAASECVAKPDRPVNQAGHWHYHVDRVHHRRQACGETRDPGLLGIRVPCRHAVGLVDNSIVETKRNSPQHLRTNKVVSRERPQTKPPPATNGVANAERHDQLPGNGEKNEKPAPQLTDTERQALFDDFLKWYQIRTRVSSVVVSIDLLRSC
jgi:hypothetical protein